MNNKTRILIVDDDINICQLLKLYLDKEGYENIAVHDGKQALEVFREFTPNLVILDIMLPGMDGWQVCREIRKFSNIPIIMLSARDETFDKVLGLELGADDYVAKPFEPKELIARIKAVLRRYDRVDNSQEQLIFPGLVVNKSNYTIVFTERKWSCRQRSWNFFISLRPTLIRFLQGSSCWKMSGGLTFTGIPVRWMCM